VTGLFLCTLLLASATQDTSRSKAQALAEEGRFAAAWSVLAAEPDPVPRARGQATLFLRAGDFAGELRAAEEGLTHAPEDQELLYFAAQASLWLRDGERAEAYVDRLERSLARNPPADAAAWQALVEPFRSHAVELEQARLDRERAVTRSRTVSLGLLAAALVGLAVLSLRAGPVAPRGTPGPRG